MNNKAVILLSGGLDSTTCLAIAKDQGYSINALTINYGQRHNFELESAKKIANSWPNIAIHLIFIRLPSNIVFIKN